MTEGQFFRQVAVVATGLTIAALAVDRVMPHEPAWVLPYGEPWLTLVGGIVCWLGILIVCHLGRWIYLAIRGRDPDLS
jgi:hypothetical protein